LPENGEDERAKQSSRAWLRPHFLKTITHSQKIGSVDVKAYELATCMLLTRK